MRLFIRLVWLWLIDGVYIAKLKSYHGAIGFQLGVASGGVVASDGIPLYSPFGSTLLTQCRRAFQFLLTSLIIFTSLLGHFEDTIKRKPFLSDNLPRHTGYLILGQRRLSHCPSVLEVSSMSRNHTKRDGLAALSY